MASALLIYLENVPEIINLLERRFKKPEIIIKNLIASMRSRLPTKDYKPDTLLAFSDMIMMKEGEDLLSPNYWTVRSLQQVRKEGCSMYILLLSNSDQSFRFLRFGDRYRLIDTRARFLMRHSDHLFQPTAQYLWNKVINVIFLRQLPGSLRYELSTVPFPAQIQDTLVPDIFNYWHNGKFRSGSRLFPEKTNNMRGHPIKVVTFPHIPSTVKWTKVSEIYGDEEDPYQGLEIEIIKSMSEAMHFVPVVYEVGGREQWGRRRLNGSYNGLFGEVMSGRAQLALGNLQHTLYTLRLIDLSRPYMSQCLTFLTPESYTDKSSNTLILPFKLNMWLAILITLSLGGFIFYSFAQYHRFLIKKNHSKNLIRNNFFRKKPRSEDIEKHENLLRADEDEVATQTNSVKIIRDDTFKQKNKGLYLFEELDNSILYTYGMLMFVSLPRMPSGWALRIMTGWWWFYCLLLVVSYRASLTAILAKPEPRVTIDTIYELVSSPVRCGGWGEPERAFFTSSFDPDIHKIGLKFETVTDQEGAISRVATGTFAYYENSYFLLHAAVQHSSQHRRNVNNSKSDGEKKYNLHIMSDCIISMPVSIGLERNSPLKPRVDEFIQRVVEAGLVHKWLDSVMAADRRQYDFDRTEQVKALMDMHKFSGALVALSVGHLISLLALIVENLYWYFVVKADPLFDKYSMSKFYFCKKYKQAR